jgi:hypothetical protein
MQISEFAARQRAGARLDSDVSAPARAAEMNVSGRKISTSMIIFGACVLALGTCLFLINYWHATACASDRSSEEIDFMVANLKSKLLQSESDLLKNEILMNKLIHSMQNNLFNLEQREYQV